jgi:ribonuclease P protein component
MIPKIYKLHLRKIVDYFQSSERYYSKYFLVFHRYSGEETTKLVVVVPKKIVKLRVNRTKMKRQIYSLSLPLIQESKDLELVLVVNKKIITARRDEIESDLSSIFSRLGHQ